MCINDVKRAYRRWITANIMAVEASRMQTPQDELDRLWKIEEDALNEYTRIYAENGDNKDAFVGFNRTSS